MTEAERQKQGEAYGTGGGDSEILLPAWGARGGGRGRGRGMTESRYRRRGAPQHRATVWGSIAVEAGRRLFYVDTYRRRRAPEH